MSAGGANFLKIPAGFLELGLRAMNGGVRVLQTTLESLSAQGSDFSSNAPPVNGPQNLDQALSDFANQLMRLGLITSLDGPGIAKTMGTALQSARRSFGYIDLADPRSLALSLALPLSAAGLVADLMLRGIVYYSAIGPKRFIVSASNAVETFSEVGPFVSLQYKELITLHQDRLAGYPDDSTARSRLGTVYLKCGRYDDAVRELTIAAQDPGARAQALHHSAVANHRAGRFQQAIEDGVGAMNANPENDRARIWLWLSAQRLGGYPQSVPAVHRMEMKAGQAPTALRYEDIAARIGLDKTSGGRGSAIFDYNNDGFLDIAVTSTQGGANLYRNNGDGTFTDVSIESGLDQSINGFAMIAGDYDNDGFVDLFVTRLGFYYGECSLYHNNGDGTFTDVTEKAGLKVWGAAWTAAWVDYDRDGHLDLFICNNLGGALDRRVPNRLFHNNGDGTFTEVTEQAGIGSIFPTLGNAWGDYNNDGFPDLFISGVGRPQLFRNNGDGTFLDIGVEAGFTEYVVGSTCFWCDYDNDGWLDLVQFVWADHEDVIHTMKTGKAPEDGVTMRVYHNNRDGTFTNRSKELGIDGCWGTMSGCFGDLNNDGHQDFLLGNGGPRMDRFEPVVLLESDGRKYRNVTFTAGLPPLGKNHGTNCADLFGDGRLSIVVATGGLYPGDLLTTSVFCPKERLGNYLNIRLTGVQSNRDAIGARVTLLAAGGKQMREVNGGTNFGCLPYEQHFGLGAAAAVDAVEIRWPNGLTQRVENPPVNETIRITEGQPAWELVYRREPPQV